MHVHPLLDQFEATLKNQLAQVQALAKSSAPGGIGDWEQVVAQFGLPAIDRPTRAREAGARGHTRGALPDEFEQVVARLGEQARSLLAQIHAWNITEISADPHADARVQALAVQLGNLASEQRRAYEASIKPKTGVGGLAGIFANAAATAKLTPWANLQFDEQLTLKCPGCGSPQRTRLVFNCEFCGSNLFGPRE
jgi:hypothetical protein